jgi:hypothetical protein
MKRLLLFGLLLIQVLAFSGCASLNNAVDNSMGINPKTGCAYGIPAKDCCGGGVSCGQAYNDNQVPPPIKKTMQSQN